jgi:hypothetical protein
LRHTLADAAAVGDLAALRARLDALGGTVEKLTEEQQAEAKAALEAAVAERTAIVAQAETLAAKDPQSVQWKQASAQMEALFTRWKEHQQTGPRLPKKQADELWKRFRAARGTLDTNRRAFFATLDAEHKGAKTTKQALISKAEALAPQGVAGIPAYRRLLDEWKAAGRAGKKVDDALWAAFKAAGDVLYQAKAEVDARENEEFQANLEQKLALLSEAEPLLSATDRVVARNTLTNIQRRWDAIGKVPRDQVRSVEDRLRKIEQSVKALEDTHWSTSNPEKKARSEGLASQLHDAIAQLERQLEDARTAKDTQAIAELSEALDARRAWLAAVGD